MRRAPAVSLHLSAVLGGTWQVSPQAGSGFCRLWQARSSAGGTLFVKSAPAAQSAVLQAEAEGLAALAATGSIAVPAVVFSGISPASDTTEATALLVLEWLELRAPDAGFGTRLGQALGALHAATPAAGEGRFGWHGPNWLGATPQVNTWSRGGGLPGWLEFHREQRLEALCSRLAETAAPGGPTADLLAAVHALLPLLPRFFDDGHEPRPSLIHGDLWSGNWGQRRDGRPVIFDPAVSYSDAEAELAMMVLFGAPPAGFWPAWHSVMGPRPGLAKRCGLYQLYHLLNHTLLFGGAYGEQALRLAVALRGQLGTPAAG